MPAETDPRRPTTGGIYTLTAPTDSFTRSYTCRRPEPTPTPCSVDSRDGDDASEELGGVVEGFGDAGGGFHHPSPPDEGGSRVRG